jgi:mannitol-specific phosphotransferase system IIBC component
MQFLSLLIATALAAITLPIWAGVLSIIIGTGFYLLVNHFWALLIGTVVLFILAARASA